MRRYRRRLRAGTAVVGVEVSAATVGYLVRAGYLRSDREALPRAEIARAIALALAAFARER
jgi:hypothetical protein